MSTLLANAHEKREKTWQLVDAKGQVLGRLATQVARLLMGKDKPDYTPHVETGAGVIVINAAAVTVTGKKRKQKLYKSYSGFPGGLKERNFERVLREDPTHIFTSAVKGMLPKNRLGRRMLTHLLVYPESNHPHAAQLQKRTAVKPKAPAKKTAVKKDSKK